MSEERFMKNFSGQKVFSLEYDKETLKDMVLEKQEEIERLNNIINEAIKYIWTTKYEYGDLEDDNEDFDVDIYELLSILHKVGDKE